MSEEKLKRSPWLFVLPASIMIIWQVVMGWQAGFSVMRLIFLLVGIVVIGWSFTGRHKGDSQVFIYHLVVMASACLFWLSALEMTLRYTSIFVLGFCLFLAAGTLHVAVLLWINLSRDQGRGFSRITTNIAFSLSLFVILICMMEGTARIFFPLEIWAAMPDDPSAGRWFVVQPDGRALARPGFSGKFIHPEFSGIRVEINDYGLRDDMDEARLPRKDEASVLVLGDSFVFGTGVTLEQTFQERLEARGEEITTKKLRVYGGGIPGYGTLDELHMLDQFAPKTKPEVVIVALYEGNDFLDNWKSEQRIALSGSDNHKQGAQHTTVQSSPFRLFFKGLLTKRFWTASSATFQKLTRGRGYFMPFLQETLLRGGAQDGQNQYRDRLIQQLLHIARRCEALHAEFVIMVIPSILQAEPATFQKALSRFGATRSNELSRTVFHNDFVSRLRQHNLTVVDMLPVLEYETRAGRACYHREGHWNPHGHEIATRELVPVLANFYTN